MEFNEMECELGLHKKINIFQKYLKVKVEEHTTLKSVPG